MKTKPFLLATAGSTVDGRVIDENMLVEMAETYDPQTYGARLNIEHIRGLTGEGSFRAMGDVIELSVADVDVKIGGETEKRKGLYGVFDVTEDAKKLNDAGQKVYSSIEIEPNFGGKGKAYLMGCALTDSPASIATERLKFNCIRPGALNLSRDEAALLDFVDASGAGQEGEDSVSRFGTMLENVFAKFIPQKEEPKQPDPASQGGGTPADAGTAFNVADLKPVFEGFSAEIGKQLTAITTEMREANDQFAVKLKKLEQQAENTPSQTYTARPQGGANAGGFAGF